MNNEVAPPPPMFRKSDTHSLLCTSIAHPFSLVEADSVSFMYVYSATRVLLHCTHTLEGADSLPRDDHLTFPFRPRFLPQGAAVFEVLILFRSPLILEVLAFLEMPFEIMLLSSRCPWLLRVWFSPRSPICPSRFWFLLEAPSPLQYLHWYCGSYIVLYLPYILQLIVIPTLL